jgi:hypothetical protein
MEVAKVKAKASIRASDPRKLCQSSIIAFTLTVAALAERSVTPPTAATMHPWCTTVYSARMSKQAAEELNHPFLRHEQ